jgi:predicted metal-dependent hydrolase
MDHEMLASEGLYHPLYLEGIEQFNACEYYESHEVWEELWTDYRGPARKFYQGLIQAAVALYHFGNGNLRGARKLHGSVHGYLEPYAPRYLGLDLTAFLAGFDRCLAEVVAGGEEPQAILDPELLPEIHLEPPPAGEWPGDENRR